MRYRSQFGSLLNERGLIGVAVEIGVYTGTFSLALLKRWRGKRLWLVDPWRYQADYLDSWNAGDAAMARRLAIAQRRLAGHSRRVGWIRKRSDRASRLFRRCSLDFVYIDANHAYLHAKQDISLWYPKVRRGGILAGHDYFNAIADANCEPAVFGDCDRRLFTSYGMKAAVDEFAAANGRQVLFTSERLPSWYLVKS